MAKEPKITAADQAPPETLGAPLVKQATTPPAPAVGLVRGVIMEDGVFSSLGVHKKGEKVEIPESDVVALEKNNFITRL